MTVIEPEPTAGLIERAKNILLQPAAEWDKISTERASLQKLLSGYVLPLALIAAAAAFIGMSVIGISAFGVSYRVPLIAGVLSALLQLVMTLAGIWALGLIINLLAPNFGAAQDEVRANQLAAYSATAGLIGSFAMVLPMLAILAFVGGLYSLVLLYIGLPRMMRTPEDKRLAYFVTIIVIAIVAGIVLGAVLGAVRTTLAPIGGGYAASGSLFGTPAPERNEVQLPGGGSIDMAELERAAKQMEEMTSNPEAAAAAAAISAERLKSLLPETLPGGWTRTEISTGTSGAMGGVANASGVYERGDARIDLGVTDLGAMGGMAAMAGAFGAQGSRETADGYERAGPVDGRFTIEELDRPGRTAKYGVIAAQRIMLQADGHNVSMEDVRGAVEAIGISRAEAMAAQPAPNALPPGAPAPG